MLGAPRPKLRELVKAALAEGEGTPTEITARLPPGTNASNIYVSQILSKGLADGWCCRPSRGTYAPLADE